MVTTRRARLLEFAVLGLLHEGPTHGYDLRRRLNTALGPFRALSYGTLYPALKGLLGRGLIAETPTRPARAASAPAWSTSSPPPARSTSPTSSPAPTPRPGTTTASTCGSRSSPAPSRTCGCASSRAAAPASQEDLERVRDAAARSRERIDAYTSALQRHGEETTEREVRWLSELIDAERRHPTDPGPQP